MSEPTRIDAFVGKNTEYYARKWQQIEQGSALGGSFNGAALIGGVIWLIYRKLYAPMGIILLVILADVSVFIALEESGIVSSTFVEAWDRVSMYLYGGVMAVWGNYWYLRKFRKLDEESKIHSPDPEIQESFLREKGVTNTIGVWIGVLLVVALIVLVVLDEIASAA